MTITRCPTRNECMQLCDTNDLRGNLAKLLESFCLVYIDSRGPEHLEPSLSERQMNCSNYAIEAAAQGKWEIAMHELSDAFENNEGSKLLPTDRNPVVPDRKLTYNEIIYFSAITQALWQFYNMTHS